MKAFHDAGVRTTCFISPIFPGLTDLPSIIHRAKNQCNLVWLENLNLRGGYKKTIFDYITEKHPDLLPLYDTIYNKKKRTQLLVNAGCADAAVLPRGRATVCPG